MRQARILLAVFGLMATLSAAQNQDFSEVQMKVSKVAGNVYVLEGAGGNIADEASEAAGFMVKVFRRFCERRYVSRDAL